MLCGCTSTSTWLTGRPYRWQASMTSSPLFMRLAESTEILAPMLQFGWFRAWAGVTEARKAASLPRNGPPEAVRMSLESSLPSASAWPHRAWNSALCSESTGRMMAPLARAAWRMSRPPRTRLSLLASAMRLPALAAARVGRKPAAPTMAESTRSDSGPAAMVS